MLSRLRRKLGEATLKRKPSSGAPPTTTVATTPPSPGASGRTPEEGGPPASVLQQWFPLYGGWYAQDIEDTSLPKVDHGYIIIESFYTFF